jgi:hypothetical protein
MLYFSLLPQFIHDGAGWPIGVQAGLLGTLHMANWLLERLEGRSAQHGQGDGPLFVRNERPKAGRDAGAAHDRPSIGGGNLRRHLLTSAAGDRATSSASSHACCSASWASGERANATRRPRPLLRGTPLATRATPRPAGGTRPGRGRTGCPVRRTASRECRSASRYLPVRSRCLQPGQQQGRRWPSSSSSWVR